MARFSPAPEVEAVAKNLIPIHHPHLHNTRVEYVFREKHSASNGKAVWGNARKVSGMAALLATPGAVDSADLTFFVIEIARDVWEAITVDQRKALVDHELSHCGIELDDDGNTKLVILGHDLEEFAGVVRRHGMWRDDIAAFLQRVGTRQLSLFADTIDAASTDDAAA